MHISNLIRRRTLKVAARKTMATFVALFTVVNVTSLGLLARPLVANATSASIWTTQVTCATPADQDANEYANGDHVYVRGRNFVADTDYYGQIHGQPGSSSEDPSELVTSFSAHSDADGYFCVDAYTVGSDDGVDNGVYTVDVWDNPNYDGGSKNDNYHVNGLGTFVIHKGLDADHNGTFEGNDDAGNTTGFRWVLDDAADLNLFGTSYPNIPLGSHTINENTLPGYHFVGWTLGANPQLCNDPANLSQTSPTLNSAAGETAELLLCNAANTPEIPTGTITVHKLLDSNGDGTYDTSDPALNDDFGWRFVGETDWRAFGSTAVKPLGDNYPIEETMPAGYHKNGWQWSSGPFVCGEQINSGNPAPELAPGEDSVTVTYCNGKDAFDITVNKVVVPLHGDQQLLTSDDPWTWSVGDATRHSQEFVILPVSGADTTVTETPDLYPTSGYSTTWSCVWDTGEGTIQVGSGDERSFNPSEDWDTTISNNRHYTCTFTNTELEQNDGTISGTKYYDWNRNNIADPEDQPLANWTIFLDLNDNDQLDGGDVSTTTDTNGHYSFTGLKDTEFDVCEVLPLGWAHSINPAGITYHASYCVREVEPDATIDFHNYLTGEIHGFKWNDANGNQIYDQGLDLPGDICDILPFLCGPSESKLANWTIKLYDLADTELATTTTDENGDYQFADLAPGQYRVCEVQQAGWQQTFPLNEAGNCHQVTVNQENNNGDTCGFQPSIQQDIVIPQLFTSACNFGNQPLPILTITKAVDKAVALPGDTLNYTITVHNSGAADAFGVRVDDILPSNVSAPSEVVPETTPPAEGHMIWDNQVVPAGGDKVYTFKVVINSPLPSGTTNIVNTVNLSNSPVIDELSGPSGASSVTFSSILPNAVLLTPGPIYSGTATVTTVVTIHPTISITKTVTPTQTNPSTPVSYTLAWSVGGNAAATGVVMSDPIPSKVDFISADSGGVFDSTTRIITWNLGTKNPGDSGTVHWDGVIVGTAPAGPISNTASIDSAENDPVSSTATLTNVIPQVLGATSPDLSVTKKANVATAKPGDVVKYTIVVTNIGTSDAENVVLKDILPSGLSFTHSSGSSLSWNLGTLNPGESKTVLVDVRIDGGIAKGKYTNTASVTATDVSARQAKASINVIVPQVLGLATTGVGPLDYFIFVIGSLLIMAGFSLVYARRRPLVPIQK